MGSEAFWRHYDTMYAGKDYASEVATIIPLLKGAERLLDVGCGTGEHARHFAKSGILVFGIDLDMAAIDIAFDKRVANANFVCAPVETISLYNMQAAVSLFNVINYILTRQALASFFVGVGSRLSRGAPFVFDCWNGDAAMADPPHVKVTEFGTLTPTLDRGARRVHMRLDACVNGESFTHEFDHQLWTVGELTAALDAAGFRNIRVTPWMRPEETATEQDWKIMFICEKI